jgi:hypothetical protein
MRPRNTSNKSANASLAKTVFGGKLVLICFMFSVATVNLFNLSLCQFSLSMVNTFQRKVIQSAILNHMAFMTEKSDILRRVIEGVSVYMMTLDFLYCLFASLTALRESIHFSRPNPSGIGTRWMGFEFSFSPICARLAALCFIAKRLRSTIHAGFHTYMKDYMGLDFQTRERIYA